MLTAEQVDARTLDPAALETPEDCSVAMDALDRIIANIEAQLDRAHADFIEEGISADGRWRANTKLALKHIKRKRVAVQEHRARLVKQRKQESSRSFERAFMSHARALLPSDVFCRVLDAVHEAHPEFRSGANADA